MWVWLANIVVIAILAALYYFAKIAGWQLCLAFAGGFAFCYIGFKCWEKDKDMPTIN